MISGCTRKEQLKTSLGLLEAFWSDHSIGAQTCHRVKVKIPRAFQALQLLQDSRDWAFVWQGRNDGFLTLALDALTVISEADRLKMSGDSVLHWYGGQPFAGEGSAEWGDLRRGLWFLPAISWRLTADQSILIIQSLSSDKDAADTMRLKLLEVLEKAVGTEDLQPKVPRLLNRTDTPSFPVWSKSLEAAKRGFRDGLLSKVVLSRSSLLKLDTGGTWLYWLDRLLHYQEESYIFALKSPDGRVFLGRSPERLLAWKDGVFQVDAIAGTRRRGASPLSDERASRDLRDSPKDLVEHRYVTQYIARLLRSLSLQFEVLDDEKLLQLTHVQHLRTRFQGQLTAQVDAIELLSCLHPTPAVAGLPTSDAIEFIQQNEETGRGFYAGFVGWCGGVSGECAIGIRSALVYDDFIRVFAGAGIVADSDAEAEWDETELKMQNFLFGLESILDAVPIPESIAVSQSSVR